VVVIAGRREKNLFYHLDTVSNDPQGDPDQTVDICFIPQENRGLKSSRQSGMMV
jgi:hypothetical protein